QLRHSSLDLAGVTQVDWTHLHPQQRSGALDCRELANSDGQIGITNNSRSPHARRDLLQQLKPFDAEAVFEIDEAGGITAWPSETRDETGAHRIGNIHEHDWDGAGRPKQRTHGRSASGQDDIRRQLDQLRHISANTIEIADGPAVVYLHIAADSPAQFRKS